jgi:hypothetical protein
MKGDGESEMDSVKEEGIHTRNILDQFTAVNPLMAFKRPLVLTNLGKPGMFTDGIQTHTTVSEDDSLSSAAHRTA